MKNKISLQEQLNQHKLELLANQAKQFELSQRSKELTVIVKSLEVGVTREKELLMEMEDNKKEDK